MGHEGSADPRRYSESVGQGMQTNTYSDRNVRKGAYARNVLPGNSDMLEVHFMFCLVHFTFCFF